MLWYFNIYIPDEKNNCSLNGVLLLYIHDTPNQSGEFSWIRSGTEKCKYSHFQPQIEVAAMRYDHFEVRLKHRALINVWCTNISCRWKVALLWAFFIYFV